MKKNRLIYLRKTWLKFDHNPDPHWIRIRTGSESALDPDPHSYKMLDPYPDPHVNNADPKHCRKPLKKTFCGNYRSVQCLCPIIIIK
jgi:hypothetical protein